MTQCSMTHDPIKTALLAVPVQWRGHVFEVAKDRARRHQGGACREDSLTFQDYVLHVAWSIVDQERRGAL